MSKKVYIAVGHGGKDPGAVKYIVEKEYTLKVAFELAGYLSAAGVDYKMNRTQDIDTDLDKYVKECNAYNPDLVISIHFNAGGGTGFEVYRSIIGGTSQTLAENIDAEVKKIFSSRGVRTRKGDNGRDYFGIIRDTSAPAVLCEGGFVDNEKDADFIKANYKKLAKAYADGIIKTLGIANNNAVSEKILDTTGYKKGDAGNGVLALKCLLLTAKSLGINKYGMYVDGVFGDGTLNAVNYLLQKWGYKPIGVAGHAFIKKLYEEIAKKV